MHTQTNKDEVLKRLACIEGHLQGIHRMVEGDACCADILQQTYAVRRAIEKVEDRLLHGYLRFCVPAGLPAEREQELNATVAELFAVSRRGVSAKIEDRDH